jgi:hypothetical protein
MIEISTGWRLRSRKAQKYTHVGVNGGMQSSFSKGAPVMQEEWLIRRNHARGPCMARGHVSDGWSVIMVGAG